MKSTAIYWNILPYEGLGSGGRIRTYGLWGFAPRLAQESQNTKRGSPYPPRVPNYSGVSLEQPTLFHL